MYFFNKITPCTNSTPSLVLILDHDETIAISEKKPNGEYVIQKDGSINAIIMDKLKLQHLVERTILLRIPIHIVTARADIPGDRKVVEGIIDSVNGFHTGPGGFKREHIHFTSTKKNGIWKPIFTKAEIIQYIHHSLYPNLPKDAFLFVDDMPQYLEAVEKAGYQIIQANPQTKEHFELIERFIADRSQLYTEQLSSSQRQYNQANAFSFSRATPRLPMGNVTMMIVGGFIAIVGIAAIALAFTILNVTTLNSAGLIVAGLGIAITTSGIGLFSSGTTKDSTSSKKLSGCVVNTA